jgi:hypothetical protein
MTLALRRLDSREPGFAETLTRLLAYADEVDAEVEASVAAILADVRSRGDAAVLEYTKRFDAIDARRWPSSRSPPPSCGPRSRRCRRRSARARGRGRADPRLPRAPARGRRQSWSYRDGRRHAARPEGDAARPRRHLRAGRQGGVSVERADERAAGEGRRASARS